MPIAISRRAIRWSALQSSLISQELADEVRLPTLGNCSELYTMKVIRRRVEARSRLYVFVLTQEDLRAARLQSAMAWSTRDVINWRFRTRSSPGAAAMNTTARSSLRIDQKYVSSCAAPVVVARRTHDA